MQCAQLRGGGRPELVAEQHAEALEGLKCLGLISAGSVCPHEERVARLAERREIHELARRELRARRPLAPQRERCLRQQLERLQPVILCTRRHSSSQGASNSGTRSLSYMSSATWACPAAASGSPGSAARAAPSAAAATSTSTIASSGSSSRSSERPWSSSAPSARRRPESSVLSVAAGSRGTLSGQSAPMSRRA